MAEKMNDWEMIAAVYKNAVSMPDLDGRALEMAIGIKLADMVKEHAQITVALSGNAYETEVVDDVFLQLLIARHEGNHYLLAFPNEETVKKTDFITIDRECGEIFTHVMRKPQMRGIRLICGIDTKSGDFEAYELTRPMLAIALKA